MGRSILPMKSQDLAAVMQLERSSHPFPWTTERFRQELENPVASIDLLWEDGQLAGYLCAWLVCGELEIHNLATAPEFRRRGVARQLIAHVLGDGKARGMETAWLEVRAGNQAAIALYHNCGFDVVHRRQGYYQDGEDALVMARRKDESGSRSARSDNSDD